MENFLIQAGYRMHWNEMEDAPKDAEGWLEIGAGITDMDPENNENVQDDFYYNKGGNATSEVVGAQEVFSFSGHREYADAFQNKAYHELKQKRGQHRRGTFKCVYPDGFELLTNATLANINGPGGPANEKGGISFEVRCNGLAETDATNLVEPEGVNATTTTTDPDQD